MSQAKKILKDLEDLVGVPNTFGSEDIDKDDVPEEQKNDYEAHRHDHEEE